MAESKFWLRTEKKFRKLQTPPPQPGEVQHERHNGLCAWWMPDGWPDDGKGYHLFDDGHDVEANSNIERLFKNFAESAEVELGHAGGEPAVFAWLDRIRLEGLYVSPFLEGQIINRVCDASAEYCLKCETDAKAGARERERALGESGVSPSLAESVVSLSSRADSFPSPDADKDLDFATDDGRNAAVLGYTKRWTCSEAALGRAAGVHRADLSKWKKCRLPARSEKRARIEKALTKSEKPVPPVRLFES